MSGKREVSNELQRASCCRTAAKDPQLSRPALAETPELSLLSAYFLQENSVFEVCKKLREGKVLYSESMKSLKDNHIHGVPVDDLTSWVEQNLPGH